MRTWLIISLSLMLCACGVEVAGTAAAGGAAKVKELEAAQKTKETAVQQMDAANQAAMQRLEAAEKTNQ